MISIIFNILFIHFCLLKKIYITSAHENTTKHIYHKKSEAFLMILEQHIKVYLKPNMKT